MKAGRCYRSIRKDVHARGGLSEERMRPEVRKTGSGKALSWLPLVKYVSDRENLEQEVEDEETLAKILEKQANDESVVDADGNLVGESKTAEVPANLGENKSSIDMSIERLRDLTIF